MKILEENLGNFKIAIQAIDEPSEVLQKNKRATQLTGLGSNIENAYAQIKHLIKEIAIDIGSELDRIDTTSRPKQVEMEFQIALSAQVGPVLLLSGKSDSGMKIKMTWDLEKNVEKDS